MTDTAYFGTGIRKSLGGDRVWMPSGWAMADGTIRLPIQHHDEPGAACDAVLFVDPDGTTRVR